MLVVQHNMKAIKIANQSDQHTNALDIMESAFTGNRNLLPGQSFCENRTFCRRQLSTGCLSQESQTPFVEDIQHFDWFLDCDDDDDYGGDDGDDGDDDDDDDDDDI